MLTLQPHSKEESSLLETTLSCFTLATAENQGMGCAQDFIRESEGQARLTTAACLCRERTLVFGPVIQAWRAGFSSAGTG